MGSLFFVSYDFVVKNLILLLWVPKLLIFWLYQVIGRDVIIAIVILEIIITNEKRKGLHE